MSWLRRLFCRKKIVTVQIHVNTGDDPKQTAARMIEALRKYRQDASLRIGNL